MSITKIEITPRILKEAERQAILFANRIRMWYQVERVKSWSDIERLGKIKVPELYRSQPFTYANVCGELNSFCSFWKHSYEARLNLGLTLDKVPLAKPIVATTVSQFGNIKLYPEQEPVYQKLFDMFFPPPNILNITAPGYYHAAMQDGYPGLGKTIIAMAVVARMDKEGIFNRPPFDMLSHAVMIFCPKTLVEDWHRCVIDIGLEHLLDNQKIVVLGDTIFSSEFGSIYCTEVEDIYTDEISLKWNRIYQPALVILDESHRFKNFNAVRTKCIYALMRAVPHTRFLHLSATPGEVINHLQLFTIQVRENLLGTFVDENTFKYFSQLLAARPDKPNKEAIRRYRKLLSNHIISAPYVKPPHKAINMLELCDFYSVKHKEIYESAIERYLDACRKGGKNTAWGRFRRNVELAIFRHTIEPLRAEHLAARAADNFRRGQFATAIGTEFKETISSVAFLLNDKYNIGREHISVIWGGRKEFKQQDIIPLPEMERLTKNFPELLKRLDDKVFRKQFANTIKYQQDQYEHNETIEEQAGRHLKLKQMKLLGGQSQLKRRAEIDAFQDGTTRICLFTAAVGGIGLSLGRHKPELLVREGLFSLGLSGFVFGQLLGRLVRRNSISDAKQFICAMRDTVEHWFCAPLLDKKIKCTAELTSRDLDIDLEDLMNEHAPARNYEVTDLATALKQAEEDNTIVSDFVPEKRDDDDEDDDDSDELIDKIINE